MNRDQDDGATPKPKAAPDCRIPNANRSEKDPREFSWTGYHSWSWIWVEGRSGGRVWTNDRRCSNCGRVEENVKR